MGGAWRSGVAWLGLLACVGALALAPGRSGQGAVVEPRRTASTPVAAATWVALGRLAFFDPTLSASGRQSCASCHDPAHAYGPPNALAVQFGGPHLNDPGTRAVPSLRYLRRTPIWFKTFESNPRERLTDTDNVPTGGFAWDGRFDTLAQQAAFPLLAPNEMANADAADVVRRLALSPYAARFQEALGADVFQHTDAAFAALVNALQRFQLDDPSFQPYDSKFDRYLDGDVALSRSEQRGLQLFVDPQKGNCASCHIAQVGANGAHPLFTDFGFQALGVPRNPQIPANGNPGYFDLGLCGPMRRDQSTEVGYCGQFKTPSLRNVARRGAFFHNGRFHSLKDVLHFYVQRDTAPAKWYPQAHAKAPGTAPYDDLPPEMRANVNRRNAPMTNRLGGRPVWSERDIRDVAAFLKTLDDADAAHPR